MKRGLVFVLATLLLAACANPQIRNAREAVRLRQSDPDAVEFRGVYVARGGTTVCGQYKLTGANGGAPGYQRFYVQGASVITAQMAGEGFDSGWNLRCAPG